MVRGELPGLRRGPQEAPRQRRRPTASHQVQEASRLKPLSLIVAIAKNGVIGRGGGLPWDYPEDRAHFERTTRGHVVVMGRRTWEERGSALPDRTNIVVSRSFALPPPGVLRAASLDDALTKAWELDDEPFVIGGARLFEEAMPRVTRAYVSEIPESPRGDTFFTFDASSFRVVSVRTGLRGVRFVVYARADPSARA